MSRGNIDRHRDNLKTMGANSSTAHARKAQAGLDIAKGSSVKQALIKAGYAQSTASKPAANGLSASHCLEAAAKEYPDAVPSKLVHLARRAMAGKLRSWIDHPANLTKAKGGEVARMADVVERWYGANEPNNPSDRKFGERLATFAAAYKLAVKRGLIDEDGQPTGKRAALPTPRQDGAK